MTTETRRAATDFRTLGRSWQDAAEAMMGDYRDQFRRWSETSSKVYGLRWLNREDVRQPIERIAQATREVVAARVGVAGEWLRAPLWLARTASPADLQARYFRLFEAQRELARTYLDAALGFQRALTGVAEQVTETAKEAVDAQVETARRVANDVRQAEEAAVDGARRAASATRGAAERVVEQARETAREAQERAERAQQTERPIKGNVNREGEKIYHLPGQANYDRVEAEETFASEDEARAAGYRPAQR